jgi:hypothetical protein
VQMRGSYGQMWVMNLPLTNKNIDHKKKLVFGSSLANRNHSGYFYMLHTNLENAISPTPGHMNEYRAILTAVDLILQTGD